MTETENRHITLKWGTLKSWDLAGEKCAEILKKFFDSGVSCSAALQRNTPEQRELICQLIDESGLDEIYLDWDGKYVSKDEAKKYVMEYK